MIARAFADAQMVGAIVFDNHIVKDLVIGALLMLLVAVLTVVLVAVVVVAAGCNKVSQDQFDQSMAQMQAQLDEQVESVKALPGKFEASYDVVKDAAAQIRNTLGSEKKAAKPAAKAAPKAAAKPAAKPAAAPAAPAGAGPELRPGDPRRPGRHHLGRRRPCRRREDHLP